MLQIKATSITLNGVSSVMENENQIEVAYMNATVNEYGHSSISTNITNQEFYEKNKVACRADIDNFTAKVREIEDAGFDAIVG